MPGPALIPLDQMRFGAGPHLIAKGSVAGMMVLRPAAFVPSGVITVLTGG